MDKKQYIEQLFNTMSQLKKLLESQAQESHMEKAATVMQYSTLKFLKANKDCTVGDIAIFLKLSKSSATQLIERLVKAGFVERTNDKNDRRIVRVAITAHGKEEITLLKKKFMDKMRKIFLHIPDQDLAQLIRIHSNLIETLQKQKSK